MTTVSETIPGLDQAPTTHTRLLSWVREVAELTNPDRVEWVTGSEEEWDRLSRLHVCLTGLGWAPGSTRSA